MAIGTSIIYYKEDTLAVLNGLAPFTDVLTWGMFCRDTTNNADYYIKPGTGVLVARDKAGFTGFSATGDTGSSGVIASGGTVQVEGGNGLTTLGAAGKVTVSFTGAAAATAGQTLLADGSGGVAFGAPLTVAASSLPYAKINASNELEITQLLIVDPLKSTETTLAGFLANDAQAAGAGKTDFVILAGGGGTYVHLGTSVGDATDYLQISDPTSGVQSLSLSADSGTTATLTDGETIGIKGGKGIASVILGDDVTLGVDGVLASFSDAALPTVAGPYLPQYDQATGVTSYVDASSLGVDTNIGGNDQILTAARSVTQAANVLTFGMTGGNVLMGGGEIEIVETGKGLILKSANGTRFRVGVNNIGALTTATA